MHYWLIKSEPGSWSWDDQVKSGEEGAECQRHAHQADEHGHLDQRADDGRERAARAQAEHRDRARDRLPRAQGHRLSSGRQRRLHAAGASDGQE